MVNESEKIMWVMPEELLPTGEGFILETKVMGDLITPRFSGLAVLDEMTEGARTIAKWTLLIVLVRIDKGQEGL